MTSLQKICRFCFTTNEEKDVEIIRKDVTKMLQTLLIQMDLKVSERAVICKTCRKRLETNYNFKGRCLFMVDRLKPFITEKVKLNLNEIRSQIIKSDETDDDKNTCRLCLQFADNMTLSQAERDQFEKFFPEIDLNLTNFVVLCVSCYDSLQKYFIFITSSLETEDQFANYVLNQTDQNIDVNLEGFQQFIKNPDDHDEKKVNLLNEELDIKCEEYAVYEKWAIEDPLKSSIHLNINTESVNHHKDYTSNRLLETYSSKRDSDIKLYNSEESIFEESRTHNCEYCKYQSKIRSHLKKHILSKHTDPSKIKMFTCELCDYKSKFKSNLRQHHQVHHLDPSQLTMHKCTDCDYESKYKHHLKSHIQWRHTDPSQIRLIECSHCSYKAKQQNHMNRHIISQHTEPSETVMYKCEDCRYQTKNKYHLRLHVYCQHTDPTEIKKYECKVCNYESKLKGQLKRHMELVHYDLFTMEKHRCEECNIDFKHKVNLRKHFRRKHTELGTFTMWKCQECSYESKNKCDLKAHQQVRHSDCNGVKKYKCKECDFITMHKGSLTNHVMLKHTDGSQVVMYKCKICSYEAKLHSHLQRHMMSKHSDPSARAVFECQQCHWEFTYKDNLKKHMESVHENFSEKDPDWGTEIASI